MPRSSRRPSPLSLFVDRILHRYPKNEQQVKTKTKLEAKTKETRETTQKPQIGQGKKNAFRKKV